MTDHPITPPPELVEELQDLGNLDAIRLAYQAGADQELEACCEWIQTYHNSLLAADLRGIRRPKPPSLKEQALEALDEEHADMRIQNYKLIRSVLESLPE